MATTISKLDRLTMLRDTLLDCCKESVKNADEWQTFHDWLEKVKNMISDEHRRLGYMAVYPIVNGSAQEALFEGTREQCKTYTTGGYQPAGTCRPCGTHTPAHRAHRKGRTGECGLRHHSADSRSPRHDR